MIWRYKPDCAGNSRVEIGKTKTTKYSTKVGLDGGAISQGTKVGSLEAVEFAYQWSLDVIVAEISMIWKQRILL